ncbi:prepilin-type N-terminal cleavage/methylation domain-containing protein [Planctomycetota bacterium]
MDRRGFTLVELLVVIAVIMLLIALLFPVIFRARESALMIYCQSVERGLGQAYHAYAIDYSGGIPPLIRDSAIWPGTTWHELLRPYGKDILESEAKGATNRNWVQCPKNRIFYNAYGQNGHLGLMDFLGSFRKHPGKFAQIPSPRNTVLMAENDTLIVGSGEMTSGFGRYFGQAHYMFIPTPHFGRLEKGSYWVEGKGNVLFCDGHVENIAWDNNWLTLDNITGGMAWE